MKLPEGLGHFLESAGAAGAWRLETYRRRFLRHFDKFARIQLYHIGIVIGRNAGGGRKRFFELNFDFFRLKSSDLRRRVAGGRSAFSAGIRGGGRKPAEAIFIYFSRFN